MTSPAQLERVRAEAEQRRRDQEARQYRTGLVTAVDPEGAGSYTLAVRLGGEAASTTVRRFRECAATVGQTVVIINGDVPIAQGTL